MDSWPSQAGARRHFFPRTISTALYVVNTVARVWPSCRNDAAADVKDPEDCEQFLVREGPGVRKAAAAGGSRLGLLAQLQPNLQPTTAAGTARLDFGAC